VNRGISLNLSQMQNSIPSTSFLLVFMITVIFY